MKTKEQFWVGYIEEYFERKDILRESAFRQFGEIAERDALREKIRQHKK